MDTEPDRGKNEVVIYDGVCGLCNGLVRFVLPRDRDARFRFASLQGEFARDVLRRHGRDVRDLNTVYVLIEDSQHGERLLSKSKAVLHIFRQLGGIWALSAILAPCPARLLDAGYDLVASNRYRLFGKSETCPLPSPEWRERFIDG